jgi:glycosyltransferase involved in cell wall biosynthesis
MTTSNRHLIYINGRFLTQPITGVQRYSYELIKNIDELIEQNIIDNNKFQFVVLTPLRDLLHHTKLKHIQLENVGFLKGHLWEQIELPFASKKGLLFCPGNTAPIFSLITNQQNVVTIHSLSFRYFPKAYSLLYRLWYKIVTPVIFRKADAIITVSKSEKQSLLKFYPYSDKKLFTIQNGGLPTDYKDNKQFKISHEKEMKILYIGSLSKLKNFTSVIKAFNILKEKKNLSLILVGKGGKTFQEFGIVSDWKTEKRINFKGQIDDFADLIRLYQRSICLVFPSYYEASPLPPLEAMACGCPVIVSNIPSLKERCGNAAIYCDPNNPQDIATKISSIIEDENLRNKLIQLGLKHARIYDWKKTAIETFKILEKVCKL